MRTIEKKSILTKNTIINDVLKSVSDGTFEESVSFVRGDITIKEPWNLADINRNHLNVSSIKRLVYASKNHKNSRHQIDFIVSAFIDKAAVTQSDIKENFKYVDPSLVFIIMEAGEIEIFSYDIIESIDKGSVFRVVAPKPKFKGVESQSSVGILIGEKVLENYMEYDHYEQSQFKTTLNTYDVTFNKDKELFHKKSSYMERRDGETPLKEEVKKKKNKFGY